MANNQKNIVLGKGVFKVDDVLVGLTRDGGTFEVEYEYRTINADGDRGTVKGRVVKEMATPRLTLNHLELLSNFEKMHTGITVTDGATVKIRGNGGINDTDYHKVQFIGSTKDGREVTVTIDQAINLENISLELKEKDDVVDAITFTGVYEENHESDDEGWEIAYAKA